MTNQRMNMSARALVGVLLLALAGCGGGGGGNPSTEGAGGGEAAGSSVSAQAAPNAPVQSGNAAQANAANAAAGEGNALTDEASRRTGEDRIDSTSFWTMDSHRYVSGGYSQQQSRPDGDGVLTVVVVSTASMSGGTDPENGAYRGGGLNLMFSGTSAGLYAVVPSREEFVRRRAAGAKDVIYVESQVGVGVTTGSTLYVAQSGRVRVTKDAEGKFHLSSEGGLPAARRMDVMGGTEGAPERMTLTINNAY